MRSRSAYGASGEPFVAYRRSNDWLPRQPDHGSETRRYDRSLTTGETLPKLPDMEPGAATYVKLIRNTAG
jgi:hypothetical protein